MNQVHYLIDVNKIDCGKVDRRTLPTFPQSLLILRSFIPKTGHLYFAEKGTFLLCLDTAVSLNSADLSCQIIINHEFYLI